MTIPASVARASVEPNGFVDSWAVIYLDANGTRIGGATGFTKAGADAHVERINELVRKRATPAP